jgi:hypothetical protein
VAQALNNKPLIVQGDLTVLVEVDSPGYGEARDRLVRFAELVKSPEHIHTYRITPLSIWNACAAGCTSGAAVSPSRNEYCTHFRISEVAYVSSYASNPQVQTPQS